MDNPVQFGLLFATGILLVLSLLSVVPDLISAFLVVCALNLIVWLSGASR